MGNITWTSVNSLTNTGRARMRRIKQIKNLFSFIFGRKFPIADLHSLIYFQRI